MIPQNLMQYMAMLSQGQHPGAVMQGPMQAAQGLGQVQQQQMQRPTMNTMPANIPPVQQPQAAQGLLSMIQGNGDQGQALGLLKMLAQGGRPATQPQGAQPGGTMPTMGNPFQSVAPQAPQQQPGQTWSQYMGQNFNPFGILGGQS
jgi:hypothetical protein